MSFMSKKFWIRLFLSVIFVLTAMKVGGAPHITDTLVLGMMVYVSGLIALYNRGKA